MPAITGERSRRGPLFWVLTGGGVFLVLLFGGLLLLAYMSGSQKMNGFDAARTMIRADPNNEILEEDSAARTLRFRNKKTGKEFLASLDPATNQVKILPLDIPEPAKAPEK